MHISAMRTSVLVLFLLAFSHTAFAQFTQLGAGRSDVSWEKISTTHFTIIYHEGIKDVALEAAIVAEAVYPVITGNLRTELSGRTPIYLSDLDDEPNAFAHSDDYVYVWLRGILDDRPLGGIRSAGRAKWLRAVLTHELTHTVISHATKGWLGNILQTSSNVPRWFHEGTARFMEPDGWTTDIDMILRVAAVNGQLDYSNSGRLSGYLMYETGHSLVRYMTWRFGDSTLARIVKGGRTLFGYDFDQAVVEATGESMSAIYSDWLRTVTVLYSSNYGVHEETIDITPPLTKRVSFAEGVRFSSDGTRLAVLGNNTGQYTNLFMLRARSSGYFTGDSGSTMRVLSSEAGFDREFSWHPAGGKIVLAKRRYGSYSALVHDLYILDVESGALKRLTDDAALTDPAWSPDGRAIVAVHKRMGRDQLVLVDPATGERRPLTSLPGDVQMHTPSWSPDGRRIAFSLFDTNGQRCIAIVNNDGTDVQRIVNDSANNRYPVWSPDGKRIAFTSHASGIPNVQIVNTDGTDRHYVTDVAGGVYTVQWRPNTDSILVISFDSPNSIYPHLIPASRTATPTPAPDVKEKYGAWRSVSLPRQVPPREDMLIVSRTNPSSYSHFLSIGPGRQLGAIASDYTGSYYNMDRLRNIRYQLFSYWNDPMYIHQFFVMLDAGLVYRNIGGYFSYTNRVWPVALSIYSGSMYGFAGVVSDVPYYEKRITSGLGAEYTLTAPNSLTAKHTFSFGFGTRDLEPMNKDAFQGTALVPVHARTVGIMAKYNYSSETLFLDVRYSGSKKSKNETHSFDRVTAIAEWGALLNVWTRSQFVFRAEGTAIWGDQIPQEFVGLDAYDQFEGGLNIPWVEPNHRVRGVRRYAYGDRVFVGSVGLRQPVDDTKAILLFAELGTAWTAKEKSIGDLQFARGYGLEMQVNVWDDLRLTGGLAFEMASGARRDLYLRVVRGL